MNFTEPTSVDRLGLFSWSASVAQWDEDGLRIDVEFRRTKRGARKAFREMIAELSAE